MACIGRLVQKRQICKLVFGIHIDAAVEEFTNDIVMPAAHGFPQRLIIIAALVDSWSSRYVRAPGLSCIAASTKA